MAGTEPLYTYGSTQFNLPDALAHRVHALGRTIADDDLAPDGHEESPHVTVQYGLTSTTPDDIAAMADVCGQHPPVTLTLGNTSVFPATETGSAYDVVKVDADSVQLHNLRAAIRQRFPVVDTHPTYQPHITLAYVKPGVGQRYAGNDALYGTQAVLTHLTLSDRDGHQTHLPLKGVPMAAPMQTAEDGKGGFLVTEADGTQHLPTTKDGTPDHGLMGGAWAALHGGYRGRKYEGPDKDTAIAKLTALYKREGLPTPGEKQASDQPDSGDLHVDGLLAPSKKQKRGMRFLERFYEALKRTMSTQPFITRDDFEQHYRQARAHAGGKGRTDPATALAEPPPDMPADWSPCASCVDGDQDECTCGACAAGIPTECWCEYAEEMDGQTMAEPAHPSWRLFLPLPFAESPGWIPYLPRPGTYSHPTYGEIALSRERLGHFVSQFSAGVYQNPIPLDVEHQTKLSGAAGWIRALRQNQDGGVDAQVEWTDRGRELLANDRFKFVSPEWYDTWTSPEDNRQHADIVIGGALTTRPFFKEQALRPLAACEGVYIPEPAQAGGPTDAPSGQGGTMATPVTLSEEQVQRFAELELELAQAKRAAEANQQAATQATERIVALETAARRSQFAETASGWFGPVADHVSFMETLSPEGLSFYTTQQRAHAEQMRVAGLLTERGKAGAGSEQSPTDQLMGLARAIVKDEKISMSDAIVRVCAEHPDLAKAHKKAVEVRV